MRRRLIATASGALVLVEQPDGTLRRCVEVVFTHPTGDARTIYASRAPAWNRPCRSYFAPEPVSYALPPAG